MSGSWAKWLSAALLISGSAMADRASLADQVKLDCPSPGTWRFDVATRMVEPDVEVVRVKMKSEKEAPPPKFSLKWFVPQNGVHLGDIGEDHLRMTAHWIRFADAHKDALIKGEFRPRHPECDFPIIEGESADERVIGVYKEGLVVDAGAPDKPVYMLNAANSGDVVVDLKADPAKVEAYDMFGNPATVPSCKAGLQRIPVPLSGYLKISWRKSLAGLLHFSVRLIRLARCL